MDRLTIREQAIIIVSVYTIVLSFIFGRLSIARQETVHYTQGETITDTLIISETNIQYETIPLNPALPMKPDTVYLDNGVEYIVLIVDTLEIIKDYIVERGYENVLFDNTDGRLVVSSAIQYNRLKMLGYEFTPVYKTVVSKDKIKYSPFVLGSASTLSTISIGGGLFIDDIGVYGAYIKDIKGNNESGIEVGAIIKF